ncbi:carboxypeptidase-like regulatory domain-containing protein, partial [Archangium sp.]|uniref:carboxypeptidase-like regulatory domain-containing protein n=1 Tax=Archangium sp. TaxID=1872627 RepID=UPI002ED897B7
VRGRVVRADGSPIPRFHINGELHQDAGGAFRLPIRKSEERVLIFSAPGLATTARRLQVREGLDTDVGDVVLDGGREVRLRVVDADTSLPVEHALVDVREPADAEARMDRSLLYPEMPRSGGLDSLLLTAEDGTVSLPHVEEQPRVLLVLHCGYLRASVPLGARQREVTVALRPGGRLEGEVRLDGRASGHGQLKVLTARGRHAADAKVTEGRYSTCALEEGRHTVQLQFHVFGRRTMPSFASRVVDVPARGTVPVHFDAQSDGTTVRVRTTEKVDQMMLLPGSWPLPGTRAHYLETEAHAYPAMYELMTETHRFTLVPPGHYTLLVVRDSSTRPVELYREEVVVPDSGTFEHQLRPRWQLGPDSVDAE